MAPKKDAGKQKEKSSKIAVDKTFGMKNVRRFPCGQQSSKASTQANVYLQKKGAQVQRQIAQIKQAVAQAKTPEERKKEAEKEQKEREKLADEKAKREVAELFKPVQVQKVPFGVDPKTVVCQFWKKGFCEKGKKCKFAHDLSVERKAEKKDLYADARGNDDEQNKDNMADWDEGMINTVHGRFQLMWLQRNYGKSFLASLAIPKRLQMQSASSSSMLSRIRNTAGSGHVRMVEINANIDTVYLQGM